MACEVLACAVRSMLATLTDRRAHHMRTLFAAVAPQLVADAARDAPTWLGNLPPDHAAALRSLAADMAAAGGFDASALPLRAEVSDTACAVNSPQASAPGPNREPATLLIPPRVLPALGRCRSRGGSDAWTEKRRNPATEPAAGSEGGSVSAAGKWTAEPSVVGASSSTTEIPSSLLCSAAAPSSGGITNRVPAAPPGGVESAPEFT